MSEPVEITEENFEFAFSQISTSFLMLSLFDWKDLRAKRQQLDSFLHITDPTSYKDLIGSKRAEQNFKAVEAVVAFIEVMEEIRSEVEPDV